MKTGARVLIAAAIAAAGWIAAAPYWRAGAMILRAAHSTSILGRAARWDAHGVADHIEQIDAMRARVFTPRGRTAQAILLVSGVHPDGIDEARLIDLARDLAATGVTVVTPDIPELKAYDLSARVTDAIARSAAWLADRRDLSHGNRIGMIGVSFSGGLSIVAAGRPEVRDRVAFVLSFGGHGNLPRVLRYYCTGIEPRPAASLAASRVPHDYALAILLYQAAEVAVPPAQVQPLRRGLDAFLRASALVRISRDEATDAFTAARAYQQTLPEPSATLMKLAIERNVAELGARLLPYLSRLGQDPALSPDQSPAPAAPVYLLHGTDDNVIPAAESEWLAQHLAGKTRVRLLVSAFLTHVDVSTRPTFRDTWQMVDFWKGALGER